MKSSKLWALVFLLSVSMVCVCFLIANSNEKPVEQTDSYSEDSDKNDEILNNEKKETNKKEVKRVYVTDIFLGSKLSKSDLFYFTGFEHQFFSLTVINGTEVLKFTYSLSAKGKQKLYRTKKTFEIVSYDIEEGYIEVIIHK